MTKITKIIFDNDGVNIDSEDVAMGDMDEFGYEMVSKYVDPNTAGLKERQIYVEYKGMSSNKIIEELIKNFDLPEDNIREDYNVPEGENLYEFLSDLHTKSVINKFESGNLFTLLGFKETIAAIREKLGRDNVALCTTSRADRMHATEHAKDPETGENAGWGEMFPDEDNLRVSGYGHDNKYNRFRELHPDWDPEKTAVVEDTAGSTKKAIDAGFTNFIGIVASKFQRLDDEGNFDQEKQRNEIAKLIKAGAPIVVTDYEDIPKAVEWINNGMDMNNVPNFKAVVHHNQGQPVTIDPRLKGPTPDGATH